MEIERTGYYEWLKRKEEREEKEQNIKKEYHQL